MKKRSFIHAIMLAASIVVSPQLFAGHPCPYADGDAAGHKMCPHKKMGFMPAAQKLNLTDAQAEQFRQVMEAQHARRNEIIENSGIRESLENLHAETRQQLEDVLDEEQLARFDEFHEKRKAHKYGQCD